jgi:predicted metalloprotease with PDZ domain
MTQVNTIDRSNPSLAAPTIFYRVAMSQPHSHLFEVTLQVDRWLDPTLDLKMPVWTPGSYLVREYARQIQDFQARDSKSGSILCSWKAAKNHWQIDTENVTAITVSYRVFANDLSVRTNHLDESHGYFNGAALFCYIPNLEKQPIKIDIVPPHPNWKISTTLPLIDGTSNTFLAKDFDTLVDSPVEIGTQQVYDFTVLDKPHQLAIWGEGNIDPKKIIADTTKIIETEAELFGGLPYDRYLFLLHLAANGYGGLEHKDSCSLLYSRFGFRKKDKYQNFMQLVAHEFFHLWNIKRIRPQALEVFDYEGENYTTSLWFAEGTTSYYDILLPLRAKIYDAGTFLSNLSKEITRYLTTYGRKVQPLAESSFDAWIKLYRPEANSTNSQISYYLKGEMVSLLLDLLIRSRHQNRRSMDDVLRELWHNFGRQEIGYTAKQLEDIISSIADIDLKDFFAKYLYDTKELPFDEYLQPFGLRLKAIYDEEIIPYFGCRVQSERGKEIIKFVEANSPAAVAGIDAGNELLAIDNIRIAAEQLIDRLKDYRVNDIIQVTVFDRDELKTRSITLAQPQPIRYEIVKIESISDVQKQNFAGWLNYSATHYG